MWPDWAEPLAPEVPLEEVGTNRQYYRKAYASYEGALDAVRSFRYLVEHGEDQENYLYWKISLGTILELLREDQLAFWPHRWGSTSWPHRWAGEHTPRR